MERKFVCMCDKTNIYYLNKLDPTGHLASSFYTHTWDWKEEGLASAFFCFDDVQQKYCLRRIRDSNQHANFLTYTYPV
jgi:hypothetical protein